MRSAPWRELGEHVFLNRCGQPVRRCGIHALVERHTVRATDRVPSLANQRVSPQTIRHTTATHRLRSGVDSNTIRAWRGHVSLGTTDVYAEVDLEMKAKALALGGSGSASVHRRSGRWPNRAGARCSPVLPPNRLVLARR